MKPEHHSRHDHRGARGRRRNAEWAILVSLCLAASCVPGQPEPAQPKQPEVVATAVETDQIQADETTPDEASTAEAPTRAEVPPRPPPPRPVPELVFPDEPFRASQPVGGKPRPFQLPKVNRFRLKNGITAYLIEQHDLPIVSLALNFDGGAYNDPAGKEGMASLCMSMLTEGTEKLDKIAFNAALADTASWVGASAGWDTQTMSMGTLSKHFDTTYALFLDAMLHPAMRAEDLERMRARRKNSLRQAKASPRSLAGRVSGTVLYGSQHRRGRVVTEASYDAISIEDCRAYRERTLKPGGARLFVVGDMTKRQVIERFGAPLAKWKGRVPRLARQRRSKSVDGRVFFVHVPGAEQSSVQVLHFGPRRKARDYLANQMMAAILGGSFVSRINMNLREDKGYSYGAFGGFRYTRDDGVFRLSSQVRSNTTYQTVLEMMGELSALQSGKRPPTKAELGREIAGTVAGLPARFATARQALGQYRSLVYYGLPLDYYNTYVGKLGRVTIAQVKRAAKKHLSVKNAKILVVGDRDALIIHRVDGKDQPLMKDGKQVTLLEGLKDLVASGKLGKGELVILDADGQPIDAGEKSR